MGAAHFFGTNLMLPLDHLVECRLVPPQLLSTYHVGRGYAAVGAGCIAISLVLQAVGHKRIEPQPLIPFEGPKDFVRRIYVEQFYNFWRYLFTGGWLASLRRDLKG